MSRGNCLTILADVASAIHCACLRDLPDFEYQWQKPGDRSAKAEMRKRRPEPYLLEGVEVFQQTWGSTALGFGGMGGGAMTTAHVVIITGPRFEKAVYFGGRFAYLIIRPKAEFQEDQTMQRMVDVSRAHKRYETDAMLAERSRE